MGQPRGQTKILLVEDGRETRAIVEAVLAAQGYRVHAVSTGREAIEALDAGQYEGILLDMRIPELSGLEVLAHLRSTSRLCRSLRSPAIPACRNWP